MSCYQQQDPIFDPSMSSTYSNITCASAECSHNRNGSYTGLLRLHVHPRDTVRRVDSKGALVLLRRILRPRDPNNNIHGLFPSFLFRCGQNNQGSFGRINRLLGLGPDQLSFVSQTAQKYGQYFS
ncbi:hypothetical protein RJ639_034155 [Escallonia herrerae]|uniref:Xylanase inhibitor N-terminal domain-containing protein n=1 Tax=Escallonia herrerae TaxID=1293975 RepID=A0AA88X114_9ASTE|nr:hypothetical protein RJ639_034155 [Escallonia herrerae]